MWRCIWPSRLRRRYRSNQSLVHALERENMAENIDNVESQAREQTGQQQVRLRIDERDMRSSYANAFRTNGTAEEVMLDFGVNIMNPTGPEQENSEILFKVNERVIMNYFSAKRLALTLGQLIRRHEEQFGELQLDVAKRQKQ